jgi:hypothetical protein
MRQRDPLSPILFILVMDVLNSLFGKADAEGLLSPLLSAGQRLSLYADDVALFISSNGQDLQHTKIFCKLLERLLGYRPTCRKVL